MPGVVLRINVDLAQTVAEGQPLLVLEAMKMEVDINAPRDGVISEIAVAEGEQVQAGHLLCSIN
jgi:biotin carboxyl carrier protein